MPLSLEPEDPSAPCTRAEGQEPRVSPWPRTQSSPVSHDPSAPSRPDAGRLRARTSAGHGVSTPVLRVVGTPERVRRADEVHSPFLRSGGLDVDEFRCKKSSRGANQDVIE